MSSTIEKHQEYIERAVGQESIFNGLAMQVRQSYGVRFENELCFSTDPIVVKTNHGDGHENIMIHEEFSVIKTGNRHWLLSEGYCAGDSPGRSLKNLVAIPIKEVHVKEINRAIDRFEKTVNAEHLVIFSYEHPGFIAMNSDGRYAKPEDEDYFHAKRDEMAVATIDKHGQPLKEWQKCYYEDAINFHSKYLAKLLQRSYRRI